MTGSKKILKIVLVLSFLTEIFLLATYSFNSPVHFNENVPVVLSASHMIPNVNEQITPTIAHQVLPLQKNYGYPVNIRIPKINIEGSFEYVGLTSSGDMDSSKSIVNAFWFKLGARPGEIGTAIVGGHYGWVHNLPAIFDNINKLKTGDKIYITDSNGNKITFIVRESKSYDYRNKVPEVFSSDDNNSHLNLITCEGSWSKSAQSYSQRLVVFTDKEAD